MSLIRSSQSCPVVGSHWDEGGPDGRPGPTGDDGAPSIWVGLAGPPLLGGPSFQEGLPTVGRPSTRDNVVPGAGMPSTREDVVLGGGEGRVTQVLEDPSVGDGTGKTEIGREATSLGAEEEVMPPRSDVTLLNAVEGTVGPVEL